MFSQDPSQCVGSHPRLGNLRKRDQAQIGHVRGEVERLIVSNLHGNHLLVRSDVKGLSRM